MTETVERPLRLRSRRRSPSSKFPGGERVLRRRSPRARSSAPEQPIAVARAPGRLDVLGGIADYSGSLVLELPLAAAALAAAQPTDDGTVVAVSGDRRMTLDVADLFDDAARRARRPGSRGSPRGRPTSSGRSRCSPREEHVTLARAARARLLRRARGQGPRVLGRVGVAAAAGGRSLPRVATRSRDGWRCISQRAEQLFAGAPCGSMDQMTAAYGERGRLLLLLCRPAEIARSIPLPNPLTVWSGRRR